MLLQPRTFSYKKKQKSRTLMSFNNSYLNKNLNYGGAGLMILKPVHLTSSQLFKFKLFLLFISIDNHAFLVPITHYLYYSNDK